MVTNRSTVTFLVPIINSSCRILMKYHTGSKLIPKQDINSTARRKSRTEIGIALRWWVVSEELASASFLTNLQIHSIRVGSASSSAENRNSRSQRPGGGQDQFASLVVGVVQHPRKRASSARAGQLDESVRKGWARSTASAATGNPTARAMPGEGQDLPLPAELVEPVDAPAGIVEGTRGNGGRGRRAGR
jgi:hypothetical protein